MPYYLVHTRRSEDITFRVRAKDSVDAEMRFLSDGREMASSTNGIDVIEIQKEKEI